MDRSTFTATLRAATEPSGNGSDLTFTGHAALFNSWSEELQTFAGSFREKIAPGAFDGALKRQDDVRLLINHDGLPLARTRSKTLELSTDEEGLRVWARLDPSDPDVQRVVPKMRRGDLDQMSFAFTIEEDEWVEDKKAGTVERTITRVGELFDVSVVTYPAYPETDAALRELRAAAEAGLIHPESVARAETDPAGEAAPGDSSEDALDDPAVEEESPLAALRAATSEVAQRERESYLRLLKEITR